VARRIAIESDCVVVSVGYRLAPEHPYPGGLHDALLVYSWLRRNAPLLGGHPERIGVWGESAGATIAAAVTLAARDRGQAPNAQFLAYPALCSTLATTSWSELGTDYWLTRDTMAWFWQQYLLGTEAHSTAYAEPLLADSLFEFPPTILVNGDLDPLKDECAEYAVKLADAGVEVVAHCVPGAIHGFLSMTTVSPRGSRMLTEYAAAFGRLLRDAGHGLSGTASLNASATESIDIAATGNACEQELDR
jgi:acetyl esterase